MPESLQLRFTPGDRPRFSRYEATPKLLHDHWDILQRCGDELNRARHVESKIDQILDLLRIESSNRLEREMKEQI